MTGTKKRVRIYTEEQKKQRLACAKKRRAESLEYFLAKEQKYREENREKIKSSSRKYIDLNPEARAESIRKYLEKNPEKRTETTRRYYLANVDMIADLQRKYLSKNPLKGAERARNRRARKKLSEGRHTAAEIQEIFNSQRGLCANCECRLLKSGKSKFHVDHIRPLALNGSNDKYNLQCLCPTCNLRKNAKDPMVWAKQNGRLL